MWLSVDPQTDTKKDMYLKAIGLTAQYVYYFRPNSQHHPGGGGVYDH